MNKETLSGLRSQVSGFTPRSNVGKLIGGVIGLILLLVLGSNTFQNLDASHYMVVQAPFSGKLTWHLSPGVKWQGFGTVTTYQRRHQFYFTAPKDTTKLGGPDDGSLSTRFNDNGRARISGSLAWEMPTAVENLTQLHSQYRSERAIEEQLIRTATEKAITMTGPLMSSTESFATRRNDLLFLVLDQISHGVYRTEAREQKVRDEMTGQEKTIKIVNLVASSQVEDRNWERQEPSPLDEFQLHAFNLSIDDVIYDASVTKQIQAQQDAIMQVQTAIAESKTAEQAAITAQKNGEAEAAKAKWSQEVIKAKEVTLAEQRREVARLGAESAEFNKRAAILDGEGEARKRELIMNADGALSLKLEAYKVVMAGFADAVKNYQGQWVPSVVMGGSGQNGTAGAGAFDLINLWTIKAARDLGLEMGVPSSTKKKE